MGVRVLNLSPSQNGVLLPPTQKIYNSQLYRYSHDRKYSKVAVVITCAKKENINGDIEEPKKVRKQSLFESVTEALDFSQANLLVFLTYCSMELLGGRLVERTRTSSNHMLRWMGNMWKRDGWTKPAKCARKTQKERQDKWTRWGDMFMWLAYKNPAQEISLQDFSPDVSN
ncbi:hypothetical protein BUALT_Bualt06G0070400 [Buddleja alternifolia]|uniref:Uncharacterized protein n=1 Tax=Buddleja alternifolia TaxID=168488 RepID=A0AAV6XKC0_9LAMI|nr:hypothetical protein BUALT_Bualt06G0070400 [Buddleja alternifolia]